MPSLRFSVLPCPTFRRDWCIQIQLQPGFTNTDIYRDIFENLRRSIGASALPGGLKSHHYLDLYWVCSIYAFCLCLT